MSRYHAHDEVWTEYLGYKAAGKSWQMIDTSRAPTPSTDTVIRHMLHQMTRHNHPVRFKATHLRSGNISSSQVLQPVQRRVT